eukprot:3964603-Prymnesium_polylepis.1
MFESLVSSFLSLSRCLWDSEQCFLTSCLPEAMSWPHVPQNSCAPSTLRPWPGNCVGLSLIVASETSFFR